MTGVLAVLTIHFAGIIIALYVTIFLLLQGRNNPFQTPKEEWRIYSWCVYGWLWLLMIPVIIWKGKHDDED